jgi:uncharacterized membrane protein
MWIIYSLLSAFSETAKDAFGKVSVVKTDEYTSALSLHITSLLISSALVIFYGIPKLDLQFWYGSAAFLFITPAWTLLYMKALKLSPLSVTLPMMAFNPIFTALLAFVFRGAPPDASGWIGILLISIGIYLVHAKSLKLKDIGITITVILNDKGAMAMLMVAFLWSLGAHFSKMRVDGSNPIFSTFTGGLIGVATTYILALLRKNRISVKNVFRFYKQLLPMSFFYYLATILSSIALASGSAAYVFSIKRGSIVFSSLSGKLFFGEEFTKWKYIGLAIIGIGIIAISI